MGEVSEHCFTRVPFFIFLFLFLLSSHSFLSIFFVPLLKKTRRGEIHDGKVGCVISREEKRKGGIQGYQAIKEVS